MTWTGPGFVDSHTHAIAVAAGEEAYGHGMPVRQYHELLSTKGTSPTDDPHPYNETDLVSAIGDGLRATRQLGIVEIHEAGIKSWDYLAALDELRARDQLPLRVRVFVASGIADVARMQRFGDDVLEIVGVKFYADGWLGTRTCAMCAPFSDEPDNHGILFHDNEVLARRMQPFADAGWQLATHAIGDLAITNVLDAYQSVYGSNCAENRPRIEHAQITNPEIAVRMSEMGVIACIQPSFAVTDALTAREGLGDRCEMSYAWEKLLTAGVSVIAGSDYPIETQDPLLGLQRLITGSDETGSPLAPPLGSAAALSMMTSSAAGTVTLSCDPLGVTESQIHAIQVLETNPRLNGQE